MSDLPDPRQYAPATQRNRDAILAVLADTLPTTGTVLEVSSGTGEHAIFMAPRLPRVKWLPSDLNPAALASIAAWQKTTPSSNLYPPVALDACQPIWPVEPSATSGTPTDITAIVNINMIHIAPWSACLGLLAGASRILLPGGILYLYGPFKQDGKHTAPSNAAFDSSLRQQNPAWGVRDLGDVQQAAIAAGLELQTAIAMPANNLSAIFRKHSP